jgi:hypothetical protein
MPDSGAIMMMDQWVIYERPKDYPHGFVARRWTVSAAGAVPTRDTFVAGTLAEARALLPPGLICLQRMPEDDPRIVEVWL